MHERKFSRSEVSAERSATRQITIGGRVVDELRVVAEASSRIEFFFLLRRRDRADGDVTIGGVGVVLVIFLHHFTEAFGCGR